VVVVAGIAVVVVVVVDVELLVVVVVVDVDVDVVVVVVITFKSTDVLHVPGEDTRMVVVPSGTTVLMYPACNAALDTPVAKAVV
jgi:hypothetical protein